MLPLYIMWILCVAALESKSTGNTREEVRKFPDGFRFGTASASYQIEGAWNEDGKSENIWDHLTHTNPCLIKDCSNGDIANDSYHQYKRDIEILRELGVDFYRFSLSWTRILPTSFPDKINEAGVQYYNNVIDELIKYNIEPIITLYHWDLPQKLQEMGGWSNPYIVDWYADYARTAFELFGDRVKFWITINEPHIVCYYGYGDALMAPVLNMKGIGEYMCSKNLLLAHAKAYHIYNDTFKPTQGGVIGITLDAQNYDPESDSQEDIEAAEIHHIFTWQQYAHPIFSETGDYPIFMKERIAQKSAVQGFPRSRLPEFTREEIEFVKGSSDFFGLNHYTTYLVTRNETTKNYYDVPSFFDDMEVISYSPLSWQSGESNIMMHAPWGFTKLLTRIREWYNNPTIYILENGYPTYTGLDDVDRVNNYREYLAAMLDAIEEGSDIRAYTAWTPIDNFEWTEGYIDRFGLYEVDYSDPARPRTPRKSAFVYKEILRTRTLDLHYEPDTFIMTIDEGH